MTISLGVCCTNASIVIPYYKKTNLYIKETSLSGLIIITIFSTRYHPYYELISSQQCTYETEPLSE